MIRILDEKNKVNEKLVPLENNNEELKIENKENLEKKKYSTKDKIRIFTIDFNNYLTKYEKFSKV